MKGNALRRFIAVFIVVAMMLTPVLALAEEADLGIEAPVAETGATLGEETTTDNAPEGESAPVEAESASVDDADSEEYDIEITKAGTYSKTVNVGDTISASLDMDDVEIVSCSATGSNVIEMDYDETSIEIAAVGAGSAKVTAKLSNKKTVTISVKVVNPYEPKKVSFAESTYTLAVGDLLDLYDEVEYDGITTLTFSTSSKSVAPVDKTTGEVVGKKAGKATITVKTSGGKTAKCTVKVVGNELKDIFSKPTKAQIRNLCEGGWTFLPRNIKYNNKGGIDCEFYLLNGTSYKTKTIENLNLSLLVDGEVIAAYDFGSRKVSASKYGYKSFKVSFPASSVEEVVFLPYVVEDLLIGVDEDIYVLASNKDELEFIPVDDVHEEGTEPGPTPPTPTPTKVTSVTLAPETLTLSVGETSTVVASVKPDNATDKTLNWKSSDEKVATVANGVVTAVAAGTATITATANDGSGKSATCAVTVANIVGGLSVTMEETSKTLKVGDTATLTAVVLPPACQDTLVWASSDDTIAKVDSKTGVVTAVKAGSATITATATMDTTTKSASCAITVEKTQTGKVTLDKETCDIVRGGDPVQLTATTEVAGATVEWVSSDTTKANVSKRGVVTLASTAMLEDTFRISAIVGDSNASCLFTVVGKDITGVKFTDSIGNDITDPVKLTAGAKATQLTVVPQPVQLGAYYNFKSITYTSSDETVATVDYNAKDTDKIDLKGLKAGTAQITAKDSKGKKLTSFNVEVEAAKVYADSIVLENSSINAVQGDIIVVGVKEYIAKDPATKVTEQSFEITESNNTSVVYYDETDKVWKASDKGVGTARLTVVAAHEKNTEGATAYCEVTVTKKSEPEVISISIDPNNTSDKPKTIKVGATFTITATILPKYASNKGVEWSSDNTSVATVADGVVTGVAAGTATIYAKSKDNGSKIDTCAVKVTDSTTAVTSVTIAKKSSSEPDQFDIGTKANEYVLNLVATVLPSNATTKTVHWDKENADDPYSIDYDGNECKITLDTSKTSQLPAVDKTKTFIVTANAGDVWAAYKFKVVNKKHVAKIEVTSSKTKVDIGKTLTLSVKITEPSDISGLDTSVTWKSMTPSVATVDSSTGVVTGVTKGYATIVATSNDNKLVSGSYNVEVTTPVVVATGVTLDQTGTIELEVGKTLDLKATITPSDVTNKKVKWAVKDSNGNDSTAVTKSNEKALSVTLTAVTIGQTVTIVATTDDAAKKEATMKIKVIDRKPYKVSGVTAVLDNNDLVIGWTEPKATSSKPTSTAKYYLVTVNDGTKDVYSEYQLRDLTQEEQSHKVPAVDPSDSSKKYLKDGTTYKITVTGTNGNNKYADDYMTGEASDPLTVYYTTTK